MTAVDSRSGGGSGELRRFERILLRADIDDCGQESNEVVDRSNDQSRNITAQRCNEREIKRMRRHLLEILGLFQDNTSLISHRFPFTFPIRHSMDIHRLRPKLVEMDLFRKGWFTELSPGSEILSAQDGGSCVIVEKSDTAVGWPGQAFSLEVSEELFRGRSKYQDVVVFKSKSYGNVLVLDGVIQTTDRDECSYQEMLCHLPMFSHPNPKKVLIIGGGDGGILREVLKHECVESVMMCEIDEMVIDVAKKYLPNLSCSFSDPRLTLLHIGDGFQFLKGHRNEFDVGPAESLFGQSYYELIRDSLREGGVMASQCECIWLHSSMIARMLKIAKGLFPSVAYAYTSVPTYPSGSIGFLLASKAKIELASPQREMPEAEMMQSCKFRFYNASIHRAAFALPNFVKKALDDST